MSLSLSQSYPAQGQTQTTYLIFLRIQMIPVDEATALRRMTVKIDVKRDPAFARFDVAVIPVERNERGFVDPLGWLDQTSLAVGLKKQMCSGV